MWRRSGRINERTRIVDQVADEIFRTCYTRAAHTHAFSESVYAYIDFFLKRLCHAHASASGPCYTRAVRFVQYDGEIVLFGKPYKVFQGTLIPIHRIDGFNNHKDPARTL